MTREALLRSSITEFEDKVQNCLVWDIERVYTSTGFCYIIKKDSSSISAALHYDMRMEQAEFVGRYETNTIQITTRTELPKDCIITYKGLTIAINEMGYYNETMGQWHYVGNDIIKPISDEFLITDRGEISHEIGVNSYKILSQLEFDYPIVPSFYAPLETQKSYVVLDISGGEGITPIFERDNKLWQYKNDRIRLSFVNIETPMALKFLKDLQDYSLSPNHAFGINSINTLVDETLYQRSFNWRALTYTMEVVVNYYLEGYTNAPQLITDIDYEQFVTNLSQV